MATKKKTATTPPPATAAPPAVQSFHVNVRWELPISIRQRTLLAKLGVALPEAAEGIHGYAFLTFTLTESTPGAGITEREALTEAFRRGASEEGLTVTSITPVPPNFKK